MDLRHYWLDSQLSSYIVLPMAISVTRRLCFGFD
jgi:hypothetical protein